jgi:tRNA threonylcarbamoyladenosine biosynthesis protein TsaB
VAVGLEQVGPAASIELPVGWSELVAAGPGFAAYPELLRRLPAGVLAVLPELQPRAQEIARLAAQEGLAAAVPAEQALPVYLRDRVAVIRSGPISRGLPPVS